MAREANLAKYGNGLREGVAAFINALERFEAIVRADEREACAKVCETYNKRQCYNDEDMAVANACAADIRNRGNT
jgi:hypothetical protein